MDGITFYDQMPENTPGISIIDDVIPITGQAAIF
jgi:hypothetical protein